MIAFANPILDANDPAITSIHIAPDPNILGLIALVWIQIVFVTMVYGPIAAFLVEFFPAKIRYTSLSMPYHMGNGEFGGWLPFIAAAMTASAVAGGMFAGLASVTPGGTAFVGLWYPIVVALMSLVIGGLYIRETKDVRYLG